MATFPSYNAPRTRTVIREPGGDSASYMRSELAAPSADANKAARALYPIGNCIRCGERPHNATSQRCDTCWRHLMKDVQ